MRYLLLPLLFILVTPVLAQTKAELITAIKVMNILENDDKGFRVIEPEGVDIVEEKISLPSKKDNYANFKALVPLIDTTELLTLASTNTPSFECLLFVNFFNKRINYLTFTKRL